MTYATRYQVHGDGYFPLDMLRYDSSFPADNEAVVRMVIADLAHDRVVPEGIRTITLMHLGTTPRFKPTSGRWESFGWSVVPGSVHTVKV
jgi:hypothetical protein